MILEALLIVMLGDSIEISRFNSMVECRAIKRIVGERHYAFARASQENRDRLILCEPVSKLEVYDDNL